MKENILKNILKDNIKETDNHVKRVGEYSKILAKHYGLSKKICEMIKEASPMHDIGKSKIPEHILNKPDVLTNEEFEVMKEHSELGYKMLKTSNKIILKMSSIISYEHHEKWDGTGYPRGLKGEEINIYRRITTIVDVFDALCSNRRYKDSWDDERVLDYLKIEKGKSFDPNLIDIFFENIEEFIIIKEHLRDDFN